MKFIFYLYSIVPIVHYLNVFLNTKSVLDKRRKAKQLQEQYKDDKWDNYPKELKEFSLVIFIMLTILLWFFIGLFTYNWIVFLFLIVWTIILSPFNKYFDRKEWTSIRYYFTKCYSLSYVLIFIFLIINTYHLKIDVSSIVLNLI